MPVRIGSMIQEKGLIAYKHGRKCHGGGVGGVVKLLVFNVLTCVFMFFGVLWVRWKYVHRIVRHGHEACHEHTRYIHRTRMFRI